MQSTIKHTVLLLLALAFVFASTPSARCEEKSPRQVAAEIDAAFAKKWDELGVAPAPLADDAVFLRRAYLDLTGVIPTVSEARTFLDDPKKNKRSLLIEGLLRKPKHAAHLARVWRRVMLPRGNNAAPSPAAVGFEEWLRKNFAQNTPYDQIATQLITAKGRANQNPPVLFFTALDLKPEKLAASTSQIFLGVQIQCAQCHDHPFQAWQQEDFWSYAAFFAQLQQPSRGRLLSTVANRGSGEVKLPGTNTVAAPRFLGEPQPASLQQNSRRDALAAWLGAKDNPYFSRAAVNRVWALMFGVGLVDPVDDLGEHNPPSHPRALDLLAADFVENGFSLRRLFQVLASTDIYQRASRTDSGKRDGADREEVREEVREVLCEEPPDHSLFAAMAVKSLTAEQIYDCLITASCRREAPAGDDRQRREKLEFLARFEAPTQQAIEFQAGIPQELTLLNGSLVAAATHPVQSDLLAVLTDSPFMTDRQRVETLFLAALSRRPRPQERERFEQYVRRHSATERGAALSDIFWALLNSSEFLLNH